MRTTFTLFAILALTATFAIADNSQSTECKWEFTINYNNQTYDAVLTADDVSTTQSQASCSTADGDISEGHVDVAGLNATLGIWGQFSPSGFVGAFLCTGININGTWVSAPSFVSTEDGDNSTLSYSQSIQQLFDDIE